MVNQQGDPLLQGVAAQSTMEQYRRITRFGDHFFSCPEQLPGIILK